MHTISAPSSPTSGHLLAIDCITTATPIARQAIVDATGTAVGHEIFNRSRTASAHNIDSDLAIAYTVLSHLGDEPLLDSGLLFLNTTYESLTGSHLDLLPTSKVVFEIPSLGHAAASEVEARRPTLAALRDKGFALAFNHSILDSTYAPWHDLVSYLKIDFSVLTAERAVLMMQWARRIPDVVVIADKIESPAQLQLAQENQADLLQGYALGRPEAIHTRVVLPTTADTDALQTLLAQAPDNDALAPWLVQHPALLFNLLRMVRANVITDEDDFDSLAQLLDALAPKVLTQWMRMLQAVVTPRERQAEALHNYLQLLAGLTQAATQHWPALAPGQLQLSCSALVIGHMLGLSVPESAQLLLPARLRQQVLQDIPAWQALLPNNTTH